MPLDRLSPLETEKAEPPPEVPLPVEERQHPVVTRSQDRAGRSNNMAQESPRNRSSNSGPSKFDRGDRVVVYDTNGTGVHGFVGWIGEVYFGDKVISAAIGIETVSNKI